MKVDEGQWNKIKDNEDNEWTMKRQWKEMNEDKLNDGKLRQMKVDEKRWRKMKLDEGE